MEAARATSAAPTLFEQIIIVSELYVDRGLDSNNLSRCSKRPRLGSLVVLWGGQSGIQRFLPLAVIKSIEQIATDSEQSAQEIGRRFQRTADLYFRFDVEQGLQDVGLADWGRLDVVTTHTGQHVRNQGVCQKLNVAVAVIRRKQSGPPIN